MLTSADLDRIYGKQRQRSRRKTEGILAALAIFALWCLIIYKGLMEVVR